MTEMARSGSNVISFPRAEKSSSHPAAISRSKRVPKQLELSFDGKRTLVAIATDQIHASTFLEVLRKFDPNTIVDLRIAPHFRFIAAYENSVLDTITGSGAKYVRCPLPLHEYSENLLRYQPTLIVSELFATVFGAEPIRGPIMLLFTHQMELDAFLPFFEGRLLQIGEASWTAIKVS